MATIFATTRSLFFAMLVVGLIFTISMKVSPSVGGGTPPTVVTKLHTPLAKIQRITKSQTSRANKKSLSKGKQTTLWVQAPHLTLPLPGNPPTKTLTGKNNSNKLPSSQSWGKIDQQYAPKDFQTHTPSCKSWAGSDSTIPTIQFIPQAYKKSPLLSTISPRAHTFKNRKPNLTHSVGQSSDAYVDPQTEHTPDENKQEYVNYLLKYNAYRNKCIMIIRKALQEVREDLRLFSLKRDKKQHSTRHLLLPQYDGPLNKYQDPWAWLQQREQQSSPPLQKIQIKLKGVFRPFNTTHDNVNFTPRDQIQGQHHRMCNTSLQASFPNQN
jgi:hypothetical protein